MNFIHEFWFIKHTFFFQLRPHKLTFSHILLRHPPPPLSHNILDHFGIISRSDGILGCLLIISRNLSYHPIELPRPFNIIMVFFQSPLKPTIVITLLCPYCYCVLSLAHWRFSQIQRFPKRIIHFHWLSSSGHRRCRYSLLFDFHLQWELLDIEEIHLPQEVFEFLFGGAGLEDGGAISGFGLYWRHEFLVVGFMVLLLLQGKTRRVA